MSSQNDENPYVSPSASSRHNSAASQLRLPAIALLVCSVLGVCLAVFGATYYTPRLLAAGSTEVERQIATNAVVFCAVVIVTSITVLAGSICMLRCRTRWLAIVAACTALIPMCGPCYFLAIPFGVWALVLLLNPDVVARFKS